jgi:tRNA (guanine37-N1)-methyltransferase
MVHDGGAIVRIDLLTLFPGQCRASLSGGVVGRAVDRGDVRCVVTDLRHFAGDRHGTLDDTPYGGGPGMVIRPEPTVAAVESVRIGESPVILTSPAGRRFDQKQADRWAEHLADEGQLVLLCGRYKGFDERVRELVVTDEVSIGDYVLSGGELPALVILDAVVRRIDGVLGRRESADTDSFGPARDGYLDAVWYTRPEEYRGHRVPEDLLSGDHARIERWRRQCSEERTRRMRPDLLEDDASD